MKNVFPLNPGGKTTFDFGSVKAVAAQHSASFSDGSYADVASGFVLKTEDGNFYYSSDTALTRDMTLIPRLADLDFAVFPIGDVLTMGIEDAIEAAGYVGVNKVVDVHYDTFGFIKIDYLRAINLFKTACIDLYLMEIGRTIDF